MSYAHLNSTGGQQGGGSGVNTYNPLFTPQSVHRSGPSGGEGAAGKGGWGLAPSEGMVNTPKQRKTPSKLYGAAAAGGGRAIVPSNRQVTTSCQTEYSAAVARIVHSSGAMEPRGPKVFFRVVFDDKVLQFKLSCDCALKVMFAAIEVRADFVWHGIVLDEQLAPADYNMLPGEENTATVQVVKSTERKTTHAEDIRMNDVARSLGFRLRLQEDRNLRLELEVDRMEAALSSLHQELQTVTERSAEKIQEADLRCQEMDRKRKESQDEVLHFQREVDALKRQLQLHTTLAAQGQQVAGHRSASGNPDSLFHNPNSRGSSPKARGPAGRVSQPIEGPTVGSIVDRIHPAANPGTPRSAGSGPGGLNSGPQTPKQAAATQRAQKRAAEMSMLRADVDNWQKQQGNKQLQPSYMNSTTSSKVRSGSGGTAGSATLVTVKGGTRQPAAAPIQYQPTRQGASADVSHAAEFRDPSEFASPTRTSGHATEGGEASPEMSFNTGGTGRRQPHDTEAEGRPAAVHQRSESRKEGSDEVDEDFGFSDAVPPSQHVSGSTLGHAVPIRVILMDEEAQKETTLPPVTVPKGSGLTVGNVLRELLKQTPDALPPAQECMLCLQGPQGTDYRVLEASEAASTGLNPDDTLFIARMAPPASTV